MVGCACLSYIMLSKFHHKCSRYLNTLAKLQTVVINATSISLFGFVPSISRKVVIHYGRLRLSYASNSSNAGTNLTSKITCSRDHSCPR